MEDYKEKLRLAKEALDSGSYDKETIEYIFPELKENEDEKIRKDLIEYFRWNAQQILNDFDNKEVLAWLEKQAKQKPEIKYIYPKFRVGDVIEPVRPNGYYAPVRVKYIGEGNYSCESDDRKSFLSLPICRENEYVLTEQKTADKVESKFKSGDWINKDGAIWRIEGVNGKEYILGGRPDVVIQEPIHIIDSEFRLWTIQDAKDGDIIVNDFVGGTCVAIYKSFTNDGTNIYCHLVNNDFCPKHGTSNAKWHPSTKEQRDLLFQKMEEAGYEWNDEKKELKKIEQKPAWSEEDEVMIERLNNCLDELKEVNGWLYTYVNNKDVELDKIRNWLQSIKYRVQPQPKPAWSEEDEKIFNLIIQDYEAASKSFCGHKGKLDWLKSLKEIYTWRPSEEQINTLEQWLKDNRYNGDARYCYPIVDSLYQDLKKLREE